MILIDYPVGLRAMWDPHLRCPLFMGGIDMKIDKDRFIAWIKQSSTIRAIIILLGVVGITLVPERLEEVLWACAILYSGNEAFIEK